MSLISKITAFVFVFFYYVYNCDNVSAIAGLQQSRLNISTYANRNIIIMKVGMVLPQAGQQATRENVIQMAKNAENEGFDSLWVFERLLWNYVVA